VPGLFSGKPNPLAGRVGTPVTPARPDRAAAAPASRRGEAGGVVILCGYNVPDPGPFQTRQKIPRGWGLIEVVPRQLTLRPKSKRVGRLVQPVVVSADQVVLAAPILPDYLGSNLGVVVRRDDGAHLYLWTEDPGRVLDHLQANGFRVSREAIEVSGPQ